MRIALDGEAMAIPLALACYSLHPGFRLESGLDREVIVFAIVLSKRSYRPSAYPWREPRRLKTTGSQGVVSPALSANSMK
jgi:hypothetical protein